MSLYRQSFAVVQCCVIEEITLHDMLDEMAMHHFDIACVNHRICPFFVLLNLVPSVTALPVLFPRGSLAQ